MTPEQRKAEIARLEEKLRRMNSIAIDLAFNGTSRNYRMAADMVDELTAQLAALEAEVQDGEA